MSSWTDQDLINLESAIKEGALKVKYKDKEIEYRSLEDMLKIRDIMRADLGLTTRTARRFTNFANGLDNDS